LLKLIVGLQKAAMTMSVSRRGIWLVVLVSSFCCLPTFAWQLSGQRITQGRSSLFSSAQDDPISRLPLMEAELASETDGDKRVKLKEGIDSAKTNAEFGVRKAQFNFYDAFTNQDLEAMKDVWSSAEDARCVHPGMASMNGSEIIMRSWAQIFMQGPGFAIKPSRTRIDISGQTALCSCIEETPGGGKLECLNVYRREDGIWKMILHMASPIMQ
jgi:ketosteroid isomerase-like protein